MTGKILFDKIAESIKVDHPSFSVRFKNESKLMGFLGLMAYPFNDRFNDGYTTTFGTSVYFTSREDLESNYQNYARVLAHEGVHIYDDEKQGLKFKLGYAMFEALFIPLLGLFAVLGSWVPVAALVGGLVFSYGVLALTRPASTGRSQVTLKRRKALAKVIFFAMAGLSAVGYIGLSVWLAKWMTLLAVGAFLPLIPMSSPWRAKWEYRGYTMGIAISYWKYGSASDEYLKRRVPTFTGPDYYFMDRNPDRVLSKLKSIRASVADGSILTGADARPYQRTFDVLDELKLVSVRSASA
jgi:hypothetical protein